jgi:recombinational DNA repair protein (RecF pathway)
MSKKSCSRCKQQITGQYYKVRGLILCENCYPFERKDGELTWKQGEEGAITFGIHK